MAPVRIAIAQIPMYWEMRDNVAAMQRALALAGNAGAGLCAFAALALTGFHRRIAEWAQPDLVDAAIGQICAAAAAHRVAVAFGAPTFGPDNARFNSHLFVDRNGSHLGHVAKTGLTAPEATFFERGSGRTVIDLLGHACTAAICREVEDADDIVAQLGGRAVSLVLWPGQMRPDPDKPVMDPPQHVRDAQALARRLAAHVVQTNWPNALNRPEESRHTGRSACIAPDGDLLFRLPEQAYGVGVFDLGTRDVAWHPVQA